VVYRGGLENRFGLTADGGSNPSLSASLRSGESESEAAAPKRSVGGPGFEMKSPELRLGKPARNEKSFCE
jgi:hypothetical protein